MTKCSKHEYYDPDDYCVDCEQVKVDSQPSDESGLFAYKNCDPTPEELANPMWNDIWNVIKSWDVNVPNAYQGYMGANGNHVSMIYRAIREGAQPR